MGPLIFMVFLKCALWVSHVFPKAVANKNAPIFSTVFHALSNGFLRDYFRVSELLKPRNECLFCLQALVFFGKMCVNNKFDVSLVVILFLFFCITFYASRDRITYFICYALNWSDEMGVSFWGCCKIPKFIGLSIRTNSFLDVCSHNTQALIS